MKGHCLFAPADLKPDVIWWDDEKNLAAQDSETHNYLWDYIGWCSGEERSQVWRGSPECTTSLLHYYPYHHKNSVVMKEWIQVVVLFLLHHIPNGPSVAHRGTWRSKNSDLVSWSSHFRVWKPGMCGTPHAHTFNSSCTHLNDSDINIAHCLITVHYPIYPSCSPIPLACPT